MPRVQPRWPAGLALFASLLGLAFGMSSTLDYASHLDRQIHDIHCSFIPGLGATAAADTGCRTAMYSPYAALFRDRYWGGVPISLFAVGAFAFFAAFSLYVLLARERAPRRAYQFLFLAGVTPLLVSIVFFAISILRLGTFCKTCVGIYIASALLAVAGVAAFLQDREAARELERSPRAPDFPKPIVTPEAPPAGSEGIPGTVPEAPDAVHAGVPAALADDRRRPEPRRTGGFLLIPSWFVGLGLFSIAPALLYVAALPNYAGYISTCGKLEKPAEPNNALLRITPPRATQPATLFVDPLCPTCKALHQRLEAERVMDKLDVTLVLFPLDSDCNWMLDRPLHPGACVVSKAILCGEHRAMQMLEWAYENQEDLLAAAKSGAGIVNVRAMIRERWPGLEACIESKDTNLRLNRMLRYIVNNHLPVSTPQMYLGDTRVCDEDTDMGLAFAMRKLAPALEAR
ncbi:MAG TPA: vitamin K epoxide reductase family protein [Polyangiaceae bacterium]|nr:vitamin K epoxide reductase family protein [Polyangiaceae bacterium]